MKISTKIKTNQEFFVKNEMWCYGIKNHKNLFFLNARTNFSKGLLLIWFQIDGSTFETKNYTCSIKVGPYIFKDYPHSLDEDKNTVFESDEGLVVPFGAVKKNIQENALTFEVQIGGLKSENVQKMSEGVELKEIIMHKVQKQYLNALNNVIKVQAQIRMKLAKIKYQNLLIQRENAAIILQKYARRQIAIKVTNNIRQKGRFLRKDCSTVKRFPYIFHGQWKCLGNNAIEAIRFKSDKNLIIGGFGLCGSSTTLHGKIKLFDIGVDGGNQEVAGEQGQGHVTF